MTVRNRLTIAMVAMAALAVAAPAIAADEPRTAAAVIAADEAWGAAEVNGDAAFVEDLLLQGYQSIRPDGKATSREAIVASVRKRGGRSETLATQVAAWKAAHPTLARVSIYGDTAILTWTLVPSSSTGTVSSSDVFTYRGGRSHAVYSQHSTAAN